MCTDAGGLSCSCVNGHSLCLSLLSFSLSLSLSLSPRLSLSLSHSLSSISLSQERRFLWGGGATGELWSSFAGKMRGAGGEPAAAPRRWGLRHTRRRVNAGGGRGRGGPRQWRGSAGAGGEELGPRPAGDPSPAGPSAPLVATARRRRDAAAAGRPHPPAFSPTLSLSLTLFHCDFVWGPAE